MFQCCFFTLSIYIYILYMTWSDFVDPFFSIGEPSIQRLITVVDFSALSPQTYCRQLLAFKNCMSSCTFSMLTPISSGQAQRVGILSSTLIYRYIIQETLTMYAILIQVAGCSNDSHSFRSSSSSGSFIHPGYPFHVIDQFLYQGHLVYSFHYYTLYHPDHW